MKLPTQIESIKVRGFRSLADVELSNIPSATVLLGPNGSGKSNFLKVFELLNWMMGTSLDGFRRYVGKKGGADDQLFGGADVTPEIEIHLKLRVKDGMSEYRCLLEHSEHNSLSFKEESYRFTRTTHENSDALTQAPTEWKHFGGGHIDPKIVVTAFTQTDSVRDNPGTSANQQTALRIVKMVDGFQFFQFHNTSDTSAFKKTWDVRSSGYLRSDGGNLAIVLYKLKERDYKRYKLVCGFIRRIVPMFEEFVFKEEYGKVYLSWKPVGYDKVIGAHLTSDGSLRTFALVTLLNLPPELLPKVILLDEPELGLNPAATSMVGGLIKSLSTEAQIILATQSPLMVDSFRLDEIVVVESENSRSVFRRLGADDKYNTKYVEWLQREWIEDGFTTGDLWRQNLLGGRP